MLQINSNLSGVLRQATRLQQRLPDVTARALAPQLWQAELQAEAQAAIYRCRPSVEDQVHVARVVATLNLIFLGGTLSARLHNPFPARPTLAGAQEARALLAPNAGFSDLFRAPVQELEDLILKWVETPEADGGKRRDMRDENKTDAEIAHLISVIMLTPEGADYRVQSGPNQGRFARETLMPHIAEFIRTHTAGGRYGPAPETIDQWLRTVLASWRAIIRFKYPDVVRRELAALQRELRELF